MPRQLPITNYQLPRPHHPRAFTLIEVLVTVGIILVLAAILIAVGSGVRKKSLVSSTRAELQALAGICEQFQRETNQPLYATIYSTSSGATPTQTDPNSATSPNFVDELYLYPATKNQLLNLVGDKLKIGSGTTKSGSTPSMILDSFGNPISYIPQNYNFNTYFSGSTLSSTKEYLRSPGPDGTTNWTTDAAAQNLDDVFSSDAAR